MTETAVTTPIEAETLIAVGGSVSGDVDERLLALAEHLSHSLGDRLRELVAADSAANEVVGLRMRTQRAEDLAAEARRQLASLRRDASGGRGE